MGYCSQCGKELFEGEVFCSNCGTRAGEASSPQSTPIQNNNYQEPDIPSTGLNILSFLFPLVGLILYLVNMDSRPVKAKAIGRWALIGFVVEVAGTILLNVVSGLTAAMWYF